MLLHHFVYLKIVYFIIDFTEKEKEKEKGNYMYCIDVKILLLSLSYRYINSVTLTIHITCELYSTIITMQKESFTYMHTLHICSKIFTLKH